MRFSHKSFSYWALAMPGIALGTFGPDMSFAPASIFITSSVPKSYQGAAGSVLITVENLASAIFVSVAGAVGIAVKDGSSTQEVNNGSNPLENVTLRQLKASWWLALGVSVFAAVLTAIAVRIRRAEEKEHVAESDAP